ncbi:MAG: phosphate signaling complex protein PhoU [Peptococcaceae bacterium]|jgi:phosphate transport system protein|nr:phosphate signaling complex protein PhoU [Peptococcaceae bacterium]
MATRQAFDRDLAEVQQDILRMGALVEQSVYESVRSLAAQDSVLAAQVIINDERVDEFFRDLEAKIIGLIATQQPMAKDLRVVVTGIKILMDLERMSDYAVDIAQATMCMVGEPCCGSDMAEILRMGRLAQRMLKEGLDSYVEGNVEKARAMCALDDQVDYIFDHLFRALTKSMEENPAFVPSGAHLLYVIRYLERIADHATNVGEAVIYQVTGERRELN